jgi:hypothetical protein
MLVLVSSPGVIMDTSTGAGRLLAASLAGLAVLAAGCSTSTSSAGQTITKTAPTSPPGSATTSLPATPTTPAAPASCKSGVLAVLLGNARAAAGLASYPIEFENMSATKCTLYGFPSVSFTGRNYLIQVGPTATRNRRSPEHLVTIAPEGSAIALITVVDAKKYPRHCGRTTVSGILVHPPGLTSSARLPFSGMTCVNPRYHVLTVNAAVPGNPPNGAS